MKNKVIIYDDVCPMCNAYTAGFVKAGWLNERQGFATAEAQLLERIDLNRARHEIPLVDRQTGEVHYGLDALFLIIAEKMPLFRPLLRSKWFKPLLFPLYQIITYNRRIIVGSRSPETGFDCAPDVHPFYRRLYTVLAVVAGIALSWPFAAFFVVAHAPALAGVMFTRNKLDFMGHWATIWLVTALVFSLIPGPIWIAGSVSALLGIRMWMKRTNIGFSE